MHVTNFMVHEEQVTFYVYHEQYRKNVGFFMKMHKQNHDRIKKRDLVFWQGLV